MKNNIPASPSSLDSITEIEIKKLMGREPIQTDYNNVEQHLKGKRILVTGAAGSVGYELVRQIMRYNPALVVMVDRAESALYRAEREIQDMKSSIPIASYLADITDVERMGAIFKKHRPEWVYHAAAYKHVPMMEKNPSEAVCCNILGTKKIADMAVFYRVKKFIMISTDKAVNPASVMGCSKRIAELYVQSLNDSFLDLGKTQFITTRFGNVMGSDGSVIPLFKKQIEEGGPVTITHPEIARFFMTIAEACCLVLESGAMGTGGEIFIFDMGEPIKILDLAKKMICLAGLKPEQDIDIIFTGMRDGEKLHEELTTKTEHTLSTCHAKLFRVKKTNTDYEEVNRYVNLFNDLIYDKNELKMVALMKELIPEYKSHYSKYALLDYENKTN